MTLSPATRKDIEGTFGAELRYSSDFDALSLDISNKTGEPVSVNTLKRLFGAINGEVEPRRSTLDIIARYLGHKDWGSYTMITNEQGDSLFGSSSNAITAAKLAQGARIEVRYNTERRIVLSHIGGGEFEVVESENSKLKVEDLVCLDSICEGYPMICSNVVREGKDLGQFTAGKTGGITSIIILGK